MRRILLLIFLTCPMANSQSWAQSPIASYRSGNEWSGHSLSRPQATQNPLPHNPYQTSSPMVAPQFQASPAYGQSMPQTQPYVASTPVLAEPAYSEYVPQFQQHGIRLDTNTLAPLLDFQNRQGDKQLDLLASAGRQEDFPSLSLGAQFRLSGLLAKTNTDDKFPYQGRFPTDFSDDSASDFRMLHANQAAVAHITPWATGYVETLFSDVFSFSSFNQGSFQVRQAYVVLGDTTKSPFYAFLGKKNVSFGDMGTLSPFTQSMVWHYFGPLGEGAGVGFAAGGLNATFTGLAGSRGIRVVDSDDKGNVNNFAANLLYTLEVGHDATLSIGGGYINGTIYNQTTAEHLNPNIFGPNNGAWDVNGLIRLGAVTAAAEYVETVNAWPATGHQVQAWKLEAAYDADDIGLPMRFSASWSEGIQGAKNTEFEFNKQLVLGANYKMAEHINFSMEYVRSFGFAPLINIQTVSDKSVIQDSLVVGMNLTI